VNGRTDDRSVDAVRWWVRRYTAGLDPAIRAARRAEIDSDLVEHERWRRDAGWPPARIARERVRRTLVGVPADIGWRRDRLRSHVRHAGLMSLVGVVTSVAQMFLGAYLWAFAIYLRGHTELADQRVLGRSPLTGFDNYIDAPGAGVAALIIGMLGCVLAVGAAARPVSPVLSNASSMPIAMLATLFFWMGVWPVAIIVLVGASIDLAVRVPSSTPS
jgi:hypothetical protein